MSGPPGEALPSSARHVLERGVLCHLAARTPLGPHLTPVVFVLDGGNLWVTTSRSSVKAVAWRRDSVVAGLVRAGDLSVTFRGRVRTYDALDPLSWPRATLAGPTILRAAARFTAKNLRFFAGYAVDARRVPFAWTPAGRLFARIEPVAGWVLGRAHDGAGHEALHGWGTWVRHPPGSRASFSPLPPERGIDRWVPATVRQAARASEEAVLAVASGNDLTVLPVRWRRVAREGTYEAVVPAPLAELAAAPASFPAGLTVDHASAWRAADMSGVLLRGTGETFSPPAVRRGRTALLQRLRLLAGAGAEAPEGRVLIRIRPTRAVWWEGWTSGTVTRR